jgi:hypothetical protein
MNTGSSSSPAEIVTELTGWFVGGGLITMVLFPLALPILVLTVIATIPLVLIALAGVLAAAAVAIPVLLVWGVGRRVFRGPRPPSTVEQGPPESLPRPAGLSPAKGWRS